MKKDFVDVSVIVPVYNTEKYIKECLDSVVRQTLTNIEIICINDGSTDNSLQILNSYAKNDKRIKILSQENQGPASARNRGIEVAKGKYIFFMDSDDYIENDTIEVLYNKSVEFDLDTVFYDANLVFENKKLEKEHKYHNFGFNRNNRLNNIVVSGQEFFSEGNYLPIVYLQMNRTQFLKDNNIRFIDGIIHEDNAFCIDISLYAKRVMYIPKKMYYRRYRENSIMTNLDLVQSSYGYYIGFMSLLKKVDKLVDERFKNNYLEYIENKKNRAIQILLNTKINEADFIKLFDDYNDYLIFKFMILDCIKYKKRSNTYYYWRNKINKLKYFVKKVIRIIKGIIKKIYRVIMKIYNKIKRILKKIYRVIMKIYYKMKRVLKRICRVIMKIYNKIKRILKRIFSVMVKIYNKIRKVKKTAL